ncbi:hypothetical protein [Nonomuraea typhae]|uniref:hypothetical protein n=1 Tax=Nonomuraea typhae TaxID=2603600 RepID=UPI0012FC14A5|nr:hypothetical protein [Nonomuraea typhae]
MRARRSVVAVALTACLGWIVAVFAVPGADPFLVLMTWLVLMGVVFGVPPVRRFVLGKRRS